MVQGIQLNIPPGDKIHVRSDARHLDFARLHAVEYLVVRSKEVIRKKLDLDPAVAVLFDQFAEKLVRLRLRRPCRCLAEAPLVLRIRRFRGKRRRQGSAQQLPRTTKVRTISAHFCHNLP
jgi:hypothetical protein